ncbi:MAG: hypothetical protein KDA99_01310 [Planctomycetales bacterium]|nr:hypothetical protein [Planctomycetales bacterium]
MACFLLFLFGGCEPSTNNDDLDNGDRGGSISQDADLPSGNEAIRVWVVDDELLATNIQREWQGRTSVAIEVKQIAETELLEKLASTVIGDPESVQGTIEGDVLIFPPRLMGALAVAGWIRQAPQWAQPRKTDAGHTPFAQLTEREVQWADHSMALHFGSPQFLFAYHPDRFDKSLADASTWGQVQSTIGRSVEGVESVDREQSVRFVQPLAEGWAGRLLVARAAAYALHRDHYSAMFKTQSMDPLGQTPPFVRALEEIVADAKFGPANATDITPAAAWQMVRTGKADSAITWPHMFANASNSGTVAVDLMRLPGSSQMYDPVDQQWEDRQNDDSKQVPVLATEGRVGSVLTSTKDVRGAWNCLRLLTDPQWINDVSAGSSNLAPVNSGQVDIAYRWIGSESERSLGRKYVQLLQQNLARGTALSQLRLPGQDEYMMALDHAVRAAVRGDASPQQALDHAAQQWRAITNRRGIDVQHSANLHDLNLQ